jgi:2,4-dienoyl-CoA reductase-like NADH-dependent reductase (Old Yellow Enzyme family)
MADAAYADQPPTDVINPGVPDAPFYQPLSDPAPGTALSADEWPQNKQIPLLFQPLTVGKEAQITLKNRIVVAPMCQYSCAAEGSEAGVLTPWHLVHLGSFAVRGAALVMVEATSVLPNGRLSPQDSGLWNDRQAEALKPIFDFIRMQGAVPAIQLGHGGRKTSTLAPWLDASTIKKPLKSHVATNGAASGWTDNVWGPSAISYDEETFPTPKEMTLEQIDELKEAFRTATARAVKAGAKVIELHCAHGYLQTNFLSPVSNQRTDKYGGSLENRMRLSLEVLEIMKKEMPKDVSLWMRLSASEWWPEGEQDDQGEWISWGIEQSKAFCKEAVKRGVDLIDVSSGGNTPRQQIKLGPGYQVPFAEAIRKSFSDEERVPIASVGLITGGKQAEEILQNGQADVVSFPFVIKTLNATTDSSAAIQVSVARHFLRDPSLVFDWAQELGVVVNVPVQYQRAFTRMMTKPEDKKN